jgi:hypothetical protein
MRVGGPSPPGSSAHAELLAGPPDRGQGHGAKPLITVLLANEEVVHEAAQAAVLHAEPERQHDVSDRHAIALDDPHAAERGIGEQRLKCARRGGTWKGIATLVVEGGHQLDEHRHVVWSGGSDLCHALALPLLRFFDFLMYPMRGAGPTPPSPSTQARYAALRQHR